MKKILLTSTGFSNENIAMKFKELLTKNLCESKILFIPTASMKTHDFEYIELCKKDLLNLGVIESNIHSYNLNYEMTAQELLTYDGIYVAGGDSSYLVENMKAVDFLEKLEYFFSDDKNGIYVGVSAGSMALSYHKSDNLSYLKANLKVHSKVGGTVGEFNDAINVEISLNDRQAILIENKTYYIIE